MFVLSVIDSSSIPLTPDFALILLSHAHPQRLPIYVSAVTLGSTAGSLILFALARHWGGPWLERHMKHRKFQRIHRRLEEYDVMAVAVPAMLPPPAPFKLFVLAAGMFEVSYAHFIFWITIGRGTRYLIEAWLAVRYGTRAMNFLREHVFAALALVGAFLLLGYAIGRYRAAHEPA